MAQRRGIAIAAVLGAVFAAACQARAPLHLLTHEFTTAFTIAGWVVLPLVLGHTARRSTLQPVQALWLGLAWAAAAGLGAFAVQLGANAAAHGCRTQDASMFFWVTWGPVGVLASVLGAATSSWGAIRQALWVLGLSAASGAHDGLQYLNGVRIVDPVLGDPLAFNQRSPMAVPTLHVWHRLWLLSVAGALWFVSCWRRGELDPWRAVVAALPAVALTLGAGSAIGVGFGRGALLDHLDGELRTEHFVFRYPTRGRTSRHIEAIARDGEWHLQSLMDALGLDDIARPIEVRVFDTGRDLGTYTGKAWPHGGLYQVNISLWRTQTPTWPHELVHAVHAELSYNPQLVYNRGMTEGTAVAFTEHLTTLPQAHEAMAGALATNQLPAATELLSAAGFHSVNEGNAYDAAGSFLGFLVLRHGLERFVALQRTFDWQGVYGTDLAGLDAQWRTFLAHDVELDLSTQFASRDRFDPSLRPAYFDRQCPKLGSQREELNDIAERWYAQGDYAGAAEQYLKLLKRSGKVRWALRATSALHPLDRHDDAIALLNAQLARDDLRDDERMRLLEPLIRPLAIAHRWPELVAVLDGLHALDPEPRGDRAALATLLREPSTRDGIAHFLWRGTSLGGRERLMDLAREAPVAPPDDATEVVERDPAVDAALAWVLASRLTSLPSDARELSVSDLARARLLDAVERIDAAPDACDGLAKRLLIHVDQAVRLNELDLAERLATPITQHCTDPVRRQEATLRLERIAWDRRAR